MSTSPSFDRLARLYEPLERITFGRLLERTRTRFLPELHLCRRALVFGDGDGRFLARLLAENPLLEADAVDLSPAMLAELQRRCGAGRSRVRTYCRDALRFVPDEAPDLVVTHFFLDCLNADEIEQFVPRIAGRMRPGAVWLVSEFRVPTRGPARLFGRVLVRSLYVAFRALTGLRVTQLPDYAEVFERVGFTRVAHHDRLFGILRSELWLLRQAERPMELL